MGSEPVDPATADPAGRALRLLVLLQTCRGLTAPELARRLGVSVRTVRRDVGRLRRLGCTVQSRPGPGAGYELVPGTRLPPLLLDAEEITALVTGLEVLAAHRPSGDSAPETAARAMSKLGALLPPALAAQARATHLAVEVLEIRAVPHDSTVVAELADAIAHGVRLAFEYTDDTGVHTRRTVDPHRHVLGRGRWCLIGLDVDRDDWRTFRLERMSGLERIAGTYQRRPLLARTVGEWFATDFGRHPQR